MADLQASFEAAREEVSRALDRPEDACSAVARVSALGSAGHVNLGGSATPLAAAKISLLQSCMQGRPGAPEDESDVRWRVSAVSAVRSTLSEQGSPCAPTAAAALQALRTAL
eukprot:CAMPEP_0182892602 /NCGR_PEP_ID=MMETSP0034_2-20130328/23972_1 /TAXON_ID=156128 /ORGANISM="Nephroselmis pyriformis, Strain CCMP717" /LENGTH=111 /DNA_ID=CAMNT_0025026291 /DNA_START=16 /DNA_END=348 /DNA_ORIENTATION=-